MEKISGPPGMHPKAHHQHIIVRGKANVINDHGAKGHIAASKGHIRFPPPTKIISWITIGSSLSSIANKKMTIIKLQAGLVPLPPFLIRWQFRSPSQALASSNVTFGFMIVYGICLSPNDYVLVMCFRMLFQEVPRFSTQ